MSVSRVKHAVRVDALLESLLHTSRLLPVRYEMIKSDIKVLIDEIYAGGGLLSDDFDRGNVQTSLIEMARFVLLTSTLDDCHKRGEHKLLLDNMDLIDDIRKAKPRSAFDNDQNIMRGFNDGARYEPPPVDHRNLNDWSRDNAYRHY